MNDRIWKPIFAIWDDSYGWLSDKDFNIVSFRSYWKARKFIKMNKIRYSTVKAMIPYMGWQGDAPKKMKDVKEITDNWLRKR